MFVIIIIITTTTTTAITAITTTTSTTTTTTSTYIFKLSGYSARTASGAKSPACPPPLAPGGAEGSRHPHPARQGRSARGCSHRGPAGTWIKAPKLCVRAYTAFKQNSTYRTISHPNEKSLKNFNTTI